MDAVEPVLRRHVLDDRDTARVGSDDNVIWTNTCSAQLSHKHHCHPCGRPGHIPTGGLDRQRKIELPRELDESLR